MFLYQQNKENPKSGIFQRYGWGHQWVTAERGVSAAGFRYCLTAVYAFEWVEIRDLLVYPPKTLA